MAGFGVPGGGGGTGPKSAFMGVGGNARLICYVCDASASMLGRKHDALVRAIERSVNDLRPSQAFSIIFLRGEDHPLRSSDSLVLANGDNKTKAFEFIRNMRLGPGSRPNPSIELAFKQNPELIYLLTDGDFDDSRDSTMALLRKLNPKKTVKINTILFISHEDESSKAVEEGENTLQQIAKENGGVFKRVFEGEE